MVLEKDQADIEDEDNLNIYMKSKRNRSKNTKKKNVKKVLYKFYGGDITKYTITDVPGKMTFSKYSDEIVGEITYYIEGTNLTINLLFIHPQYQGCRF